MVFHAADLYLWSSALDTRGKRGILIAWCVCFWQYWVDDKIGAQGENWNKTRHHPCVLTCLPTPGRQPGVIFYRKCYGKGTPSPVLVCFQADKLTPSS